MRATAHHWTPRAATTRAAGTRSRRPAGSGPDHADGTAGSGGKRPASRPNGHDGPVTSWPARPYDGTDSDVASSDDGLMRSLYAQYSAPLLHFALRMVGDRQRAEDIVQETLLRAWRNADRLRLEDGTSLRPWLVTVARRIAIDEHRSRAARPAETYDVELDVAVPDGTDHLVQRLAVTQALKELSPPHREILLETYYRGRTVPEAARSLGLPLGTAKSRVYYALHALRGALDRRGVT